MTHLTRCHRSESVSSASRTSLEREHISDGDWIHVQKKADAIRRACDLRDLDALVAYATSEGGFLQDELRRLAWPILLHCDQNAEEALMPEYDLPPHGDEEQVQLDVNRSFVYYPECPDEELSMKRNELSKVIKQVLRNYPMLCYFQGYHDIVQVVLLVLGDSESAPAAAQISLLRIRDYMLPSISPAVKHLHLIPAIIEKADKPLYYHLSGVQPFFALSATLTLYSHDIQEYSDIARLFDFLIANEPVVSIYLFAAIVMSRRKELLEIPKDEPEMLHFTLSKLPSPLDLEGLISQTVQLFRNHPPESLPSQVWKKIPWCSVLKTSRDVFQRQSTDTTLQFFRQQTRCLRREERKAHFISFLSSHRRTIGSVAVAVFIGAMSIWIRKTGLDNSIISYFDQFKVAFQRPLWL
ncbi:rab-GTPase-TBC domain-containing protein [Aspergillus egyptiacus]|nr:rab-GTPase-TBC domain-containing protein [Aspergillus egyptiacus]